MKKFSSINEANSTACQTPDANFSIYINERSVSCEVDFPFDLNLTPEDAELLETNIHNAMELVLRGYFLKPTIAEIAEPVINQSLDPE